MGRKTGLGKIVEFQRPVRPDWIAGQDTAGETCIPRGLDVPQLVAD